MWSASTAYRDPGESSTSGSWAWDCVSTIPRTRAVALIPKGAVSEMLFNAALEEP